ncbi:MAG TPA: hypothetical protein VFG68_09350, partial [Fimbriiglobus sp.]|nr:hypothetical protein [Fimbriiglobus sp.]
FTKIRARKWADDPYQGQGYLSYFLRPYTERLWAPLPMLADDLASWPELTLQPILDNIKKLEEANKPKFTPSEWQRRFQGKAGIDNPYAPIGGGSYGGSGYGQEGGMPGMPGAGGVPGPGGGAFGSPRGRGGMQQQPGAFGGPGGAMPGEGMMPGGMPGSFAQMPEVEYTLLRFLDVDPRPGYSYQYRIRVKMKNPNFNQPNMVSRKSDAKIETLKGPWVQLGKADEFITIPPEMYIYAADADEYIEHVDDLYKKNGREGAIRNVMEYREVQDGRRALVQFQQWMPQIRIEGSGNKTEPIGTWVVADMPVAAGDFIGRRQLVELPLWSASQQAYVLRELTGGVKVHGIANQKHQPKGWPVNFQTLSVLVGFEGGKTKAELSERTVTDESATEVLILRPDGKLLVRNSVADKEDPEKKGRQETWDKWLKRVRDRKEDMNMMGNPMDPNGGGFQRGGGPGPGS